jgi:hypothetical protein
LKSYRHARRSSSHCCLCPSFNIRPLPRDLIPIVSHLIFSSFHVVLTAGSSSTSFSSKSRTEYVLNHHSIAKCLKLSFQRVVIHPDRTPNKRVTPFLLCWCKLSQADFRMCDAQRFGCNFLHRSPKILILDALESRLNGELEYPIFPFCTSLNMCLILMKTAVLLSGFWRCWWSWFQLLSRTHESDSPCLQNNYKAQSTPEVTVGNTHPMPTNHDIPTIFTCGIINLAKILMGVHECKCVCKWKDGIKTK